MSSCHGAQILMCLRRGSSRKREKGLPWVRIELTTFRFLRPFVIMRLTRCLLRYQGGTGVVALILTKFSPKTLHQTLHLNLSSQCSRVAQWKRAGPITQRSVDRNYALLNIFCLCFFNYEHNANHQNGLMASLSDGSQLSQKVSAAE